MVRQVARGRGRTGKPTCYRPAIIHATLEQRDCSSICFPTGGRGPHSDSSHEVHQNHLVSRIPRSIRQLGVAILYVVVGGAITRTLWYQYQINNLSAEMLDATSLRQANLARLESVRKEMVGLSDEFNALKKKNSGLRRENDVDMERIQDAVKRSNDAGNGIRPEDSLGAKEMEGHGADR